MNEDGIRIKGYYKNKPVYEIEGYDGFLYIPAALDEEEQVYWAKRAVESYINPPNPSSLDALYEFYGFQGYSQHA